VQSAVERSSAQGSGYFTNSGKEMTNSSPLEANYTIFFSHKAKDEPVTREIIDLLQQNIEHVKCFIAEDIAKGIDWRKEIACHLTRSSLLVLVFTDPKEDWGWCLYETGFFDALMQIPNPEQGRFIFCLHNSTIDPPPPIANLQTTKANPNDVTKWLNQIFAYTRQTKK
jgi:TIR domain